MKFHLRSRSLEKRTEKLSTWLVKGKTDKICVHDSEKKKRRSDFLTSTPMKGNSQVILSS